MRYILLIFTLYFLIQCSNKGDYRPKGLKVLSKPEMLERMKNRNVKPSDDVVYKSATGVLLTEDSLKVMNNLRDYFYQPYVDTDGNIKEIIVRKSTEEDKAFQKEMELAFREDNREIPFVEINCAERQTILQDVFDRDQKVGPDGKRGDKESDFQNLVIISNFIDQCGIPTLNQVNDVQMAGIWAVLQHSNSKYVLKYMPQLEAAANNGDIKWGTIAMMKDRVLMEQGKPQVFGTQILNGQLYKLKDPEYVNKRRKAIGMDPIEDYLKRWELSFDITQKD